MARLGWMFAALLGAACARDGGEGSAASSEGCAPRGTQGVIVSDAWTRTAQTDRTAVYLTLCTAGAPDALLRATSPAAATVELHETTRSADGVASMQPSDEAPLIPGVPTRLTPGGTHLMLIGLIAPIEAGMKVPLTLEFRSGATVAIEAEARDGAKGQDGHHH